MAGETLARFKRWFWRPPRPHGDTIPDRAVTATTCGHLDAPATVTASSVN